MAACWYGSRNSIADESNRRDTVEPVKDACATVRFTPASHGAFHTAAPELTPCRGISRSARDEKPVTECPLVIVGLLDRIRYAEQRIALRKSCREASWRGLRTE